MQTHSKVLEPFEYLVKNPGKSFRSQLLLAFQTWIPTKDSDLNHISKIVDMLHTASLLIDDIQDNSDLRRGQPCAHKIFGTAQTINSANYVYFLALQEAMTFGNLHLIADFNAQMLELHLGQGMDIYWREAGKCPTEDEYLLMVRNKTGGLLRLAVHLLLAASTQPLDKYDDLVNALGMFFQIRDDYMNLTEYSDAKGFAEDLTEGKFSFPLVYCIQRNLHTSELENILRQRTTDINVKKYAIGLMREKAGAFDYTLEKMDSMAKAILRTIDGFGGNVHLEALVQKLSVPVSKRE
ncbi:isoprenoid synthase domain-containing protein [Gorgonomyces haynaldii]|nr:isoprenoid synthase domain-containing protein [Gorgonomyces haynaldii]